MKLLSRSPALPLPHSLHHHMPLYLVATPIGNREDITLRALRVLKEVDLIACEDTRHTRRLLDHFGINKPTISYHEHNEQVRAAELAERLTRGESIALVTDAGTPGISDPAYRIVKAAIELAIEVVPVPGATALIGGLVASGLPTDSFLFIGFLPHKKLARRARLEELKSERATLVFYEAPHRIRETLADAQEILGNRKASLARELTKLHEQFIRGTLAEISERLSEQEQRGEMTLVIAGNRDDNLPLVENISISEQVERLMREADMSRNEAIKEAARLRGLTRREAYQKLVDERKSDENENDVE
ncbi:MAG: 16S rRNA (cytidine(1402)-2'-O)-methyltransferase [Acidobacteria bacterium]|nr:16S rRNA (cytidine(1402)-2'-O)-methyltransferase [Acidobacteriota bacterium]